MTTADETEQADAKGYGQYCPISRAVEVLGERWSLLIVRDMLCGATRFNELARCNPRLSRTLLSKRLRQLEGAGIVERSGEQYLLTASGRELEPLVFGLGEWGAKWQFDEPRETELDPELLMWWVHTRLDFSHLPERRLVLEFHFSDRRERYWILRDGQGPSVCSTDPGFEVDALIASDLSTMYQVWMGKLALGTAIHSERVRVSGLPAIVRRLPQLFELSPIADRVAAVTKR
ncbi:MAG: winged helix-turn-helix transcriptional regulator [Actinomycetota bacterium]|nr:winged helix-turn-helix transcriptional regulator [Actinomycetota bacterium]